MLFKIIMGIAAGEVSIMAFMTMRKSKYLLGTIVLGFVVKKY
jgi:hypothetical protein